METHLGCDIRGLFPEIHSDNIKYDCYLWDYESISLTPQMMDAFLARFAGCAFILVCAGSQRYPLSAIQRKKAPFADVLDKKVPYDVIYEQALSLPGYHLKHGAYRFGAQDMETALRITSILWQNSFVLATRNSDFIIAPESCIQITEKDHCIRKQKAAADLCNAQTSLIFALEGCDGSSLNIVYTA